MKNKHTGIVAALLVAVLFMSMCSIPAIAGGEDALAQEVKISCKSYPLLYDGSLHFTQPLPANQDIVIKSENAFSQLYILWHEMPESWYLSYDGENYTEIKNEPFLHQAYTLEQSVTKLYLRFDAPVTVCEMHAFTEGELPGWVERWEYLQEPADILVFSTHADDELIFFGGLIPKYCAEGCKVQVVYLTKHVAGFDAMRTHELLGGLWRCGVKYYPEINPDAKDCVFENLFYTELYYGRENFNRYQVEMIRKYKPLAVVGQDVKGEYGNLVHIFGVSCLMDSVDMAADENMFSESAEKYGTWDTQKFYLHIYAENPIVLDYEQPLEMFGGMTAIDVAREAFKFHVTQQKFGVIRDFGMHADSHQFGLVRSTVGEDVLKNDILENTHR